MLRLIRPVALLLVVVLLLSASGAATLCVEADGTQRIELLSAVLCCGEQDQADEPAPAGVTAPPGCGGCDDRPLADSHAVRPAQTLLDGAPLPPPSLVVIDVLPSSTSVTAFPYASTPPDALAPARVERPATLRS